MLKAFRFMLVLFALLNTTVFCVGRPAVSGIETAGQVKKGKVTSAIKEMHESVTGIGENEKSGSLEVIPDDGEHAKKQEQDTTKVLSTQTIEGGAANGNIENMGRSITNRIDHTENRDAEHNEKRALDMNTVSISIGERAAIEIMEGSDSVKLNPMISTTTKPVEKENVDAENVDIETRDVAENIKKQSLDQITDSSTQTIKGSATENVKTVESSHTIRLDRPETREGPMIATNTKPIKKENNDENVEMKRKDRRAKLLELGRFFIVYTVLLPFTGLVIFQLVIFAMIKIRDCIVNGGRREKKLSRLSYMVPAKDRKPVRKYVEKHNFTMEDWFDIA